MQAAASDIGKDAQSTAQLAKEMKRFKDDRIGAVKTVVSGVAKLTKVIEGAFAKEERVLVSKATGGKKAQNASSGGAFFDLDFSHAHFASARGDSGHERAMGGPRK